MANQFSRSLKRATVVFTDPHEGQTIVQENAGMVDETLRSAIKKARKVFFEEYNKKVVKSRG